MTPAEIEKNINITGSSIFTEPVLATIEKQEYPFYKKYLDAKEHSEDVRGNLLAVLHSVNQDWCQKYYLKMLHDPSYSIRRLAAEGISFLDRPEKPEKLIKEIRRFYLEGHEYRPQVVHPLVLAVGNTRDGSVLDEMLEVYQQEKAFSIGEGYLDWDLLTAFQKSTAKLGFPKTKREIELELLSEDPFKRYKALSKLEYLDDPAWIVKVAPLLMDEEIGWTMPLGPMRLNKRVCDNAAVVLKTIDPEKGPGIPEKENILKYHDDVMRGIRKTYGLMEK